MESLFLRGPTGILTHFVDRLSSPRIHWLTTTTTTAIATASSSSFPSSSSHSQYRFRDAQTQLSSSSSTRPTATRLTGYEVPPMCPKLSALDLRFPEQHRSVPTVQLEPLRRAICTMLNRTVSSSSSSSSTTNGNTIVRSKNTILQQGFFMRVTIPACFPEEWDFAPTTMKNPRPDLLQQPKTKKKEKRYVVERIREDCVLHRLLESTLPDHYNG